MPNMVITEDTVDLVTANEHLNNSETMLWIISQLTALWNVRVQLSAGMLGQTVAAISSANPSSMSGSDNNDASSSQYWKPWDHIYPQPKGQSLPMYNPAGKYCVRLHWMVLYMFVSPCNMMCVCVQACVCVYMHLVHQC